MKNKKEVLSVSDFRSLMIRQAQSLFEFYEEKLGNLLKEAMKLNKEHDLDLPVKRKFKLHAFDSVAKIDASVNHEGVKLELSTFDFKAAYENELTKDNPLGSPMFRNEDVLRHLPIEWEEIRTEIKGALFAFEKDLERDIIDACEELGIERNEEE